MNIENIKNNARIKFVSALLLTVIFIFAPFQLIFYKGYSGFPAKQIGFLVFVIIVVVTSFLTFYLNKGALIRKILFISLAVLMVFPFMAGLFVERGHIGITIDDVKNGLPFCHIALINNLLSVPLQKMFVSPASFTRETAGIYSMIIIWLWATILIGKGWCSWGCFYGGWDTMFSSLKKKPLIKISDKTANKLRFIPLTLLIIIPILGIFLVNPVYCSYICPFKTTTEFVQVTTFSTWITFVVTVTLFTGVTGILSIIFGKRIWCTYGCPFSVLQGFIGKIIRPFKLKLDKEKCIKCGKCAKLCLTDGITSELIEKGKFSYNCSLCLSCVEGCPKKAIKMTVLGTDESPKSLIQKIFSFINDNSVIGKIKKYVIDILDDVLNPQSFFRFFALTVLFTFFGNFYFEFLKYALYFLGGK